MRNITSCFLALVILLFSGCGTANKFAGTFGKRHYTKGYYWERAGRGEIVQKLNNSGKITMVLSRHKQSETIYTELRILLPPKSKQKESIPNLKPLYAFKTTQNVVDTPPHRDNKDIPPFNYNYPRNAGGQSNIGMLGLVMIITSILLIFGFFFLAGVLTAGVLGGLETIFFLALIAGLVICLVALHNDDAHTASARAGITIFALVLFLGFLALLIYSHI